MIAKKHPSPDPGHAEQTRKVDSMSELVAGMLLDDPDATSPPPDPSPGSLSAVRPTSPQSSSRPQPYAIEEPSRGSRIGRAVVIALVVALALAAVGAALLLLRA
jgi:hypothetical protein